MWRLCFFPSTSTTRVYPSKHSKLLQIDIIPPGLFLAHREKSQCDANSGVQVRSMHTRFSASIEPLVPYNSRNWGADWTISKFPNGWRIGV
jgi:hypothetical protein